ncbi:MAG: molybdopterin-guanine dinucleotide biosynthesis protein B [Mariprofundus sp.]|nr:molybdopterin-guanine dinucleotide biosynthesis protein B [Mariprofundus sp.]
MRPPILSIVGRSNSGKTTLLEKLIAELSHQGLRIGTIKHSHHQPDMDTPGKDSWRHKQAGAVTSLLVGPERMLMVNDVHAPLNPQLLAASYFADVDLLLVEGYASLAGSKIEVVRSQRSDELRNADDAGLIAVVSDVDVLDTALPVFGLDDVRGLAVFIQAWMKQFAGHQYG